MQTETKGRGFYKYIPGKKVESLSELKTGRIFLAHSNQFDADNTIRISRQDETGLNRPIVYARFYHPERGWDGPEFSIWDHDLNKTMSLRVAMVNGQPAA